MTNRIDRRRMLAGAAALGAASFIPARAFAQGKTLVAATFPGTWNEAHRNILAPAFRRATGAAVTQSIILGTDQVARLQAAKGSRPPFDVAIFDSPQVLDAAREGLIVEYPVAKSPRYGELLPNVGAIAANLGAYATLWQQEQIDIAPYNFNFVQTLKGKDVPVELAIPTSGPVGWATSLHLVANAAEPDLAVKYIDEHLDAGIQAQMLKPPYDVIPTNSKVKLEGAITLAIAKTQDDLAKIRTIDWDKLNPQRGALIERFNREIKL